MSSVAHHVYMRTKRVYMLVRPVGGPIRYVVHMPPDDRAARGADEWNWTDPVTGSTWTLRATWTALAGRVEATALSLDSDRAAPVTAALVRRAEAEVRDRREARAVTVAVLAGQGVERAARQASEYAAPAAEGDGRRKRGPARDDDAWRRRALAVRAAWEQRTPLLAALEVLEPGLSVHAYRQRLRRLYIWDEQYGERVLRGVGRLHRAGRDDEAGED